jgi:chorismate mutase/prephenate dehydratase
MVGHVEDKDIAGAVEELRTCCQFLKILGSYPKAR